MPGCCAAARIALAGTAARASVWMAASKASDATAGAAPKELDADRRGGSAGDVRDLVDAQLVEVAEDDDHAIEIGSCLTAARILARSSRATDSASGVAFESATAVACSTSTLRRSSRPRLRT